jgi:hypothetical protein
MRGCDPFHILGVKDFLPRLARVSLGFRSRPGRKPGFAVQSINRLLERDCRLREQGADENRRFAQRRFTWLHGGPRGPGSPAQHGSPGYRGHGADATSYVWLRNTIGLTGLRPEGLECLRRLLTDAQQARPSTRCEQ